MRSVATKVMCVVGAGPRRRDSWRCAQDAPAARAPRQSGSARRFEARVSRRRRRRAQYGARDERAEARGLLRSLGAARRPDSARTAGRSASAAATPCARSRRRRRPTAGRCRPRIPAGLELRQLRHRVPPQRSVPRQFQRLQHLRHRAVEESQAASPRSCVPGGQGDMSVHGNLLFMSVEQTRGRVDCGTQGVDDAGQRGALPRRPHLRHQRSAEAEAGRRRADLPRLAHAYARHRSEGPREPLRLRLGHQHGAAGRGAGRMFGTRSERGSEHGALQHRRHPGAARRAREGADRQPPAHLRRPGVRRDLRPVAGRRPRARDAEDHPRPTSATTSRCSRRSASPPAPARATASCSTSPTRCTRCASIRSSTRTSPTGTRRRSTTTAPR